LSGVSPLPCLALFSFALARSWPGGCLGAVPVLWAAVLSLCALAAFVRFLNLVCAELPGVLSPAERIISMLETIISYAGNIADLQNRDDLVLLTDSQVVKEILDDLNFFAKEDEYLDDINGLFVSVQDGAYGEIYAFKGSVPYLTLDVWKLELVWTPIY
jgi:hypothetical protein